jgi:hypothetical protein
MMNTTSNGSGLVLKVVRDENPENPRTYPCYNIGTMALFHRRYNLGDLDHGIRTSDFEGWEEMEEHLYREYDAALVLPVFMYDHSGITISTGTFSCPWDSGQIGFIFISKAKVREEYQCKRLSKKVLNRVSEALNVEVRVYDQYLTGDIWGYVVETEDGDHVDSCWGFFGEEKARAEGEAIISYQDQAV